MQFRLLRLIPLSALVGGFPDAAVAKITYRVSLDVPQRTFGVQVELDAPPGTIDYWIPRWQPGAYHTADYGRFVEAFEASDAQGEARAVERVGDSQFRVECPTAGPLILHYRGRAISKSGQDFEVLDVESSRITDRYAYFSPCSLLGFVPERMDEEVEAFVEPPPRWKVATVLERNEAGAFVAPSYYVLEDSPFFLSEFLLQRSFETEGVPHVVTSYGLNAEEVDAAVKHAAALAQAAHDLLGSFPFRRYRYLLGAVPESLAGSGLEHSESTLILFSKNLGRGAGLTDLLAHEYQHAWTAEAIKVEALYRPDYREPLETGTIWFNEGVTEYFRRHLQLRAGLMTEKAFWRSFSDDLAMLRMAGDFLAQHAWTDVSRSAATFTDSMNGLVLFTTKFYQAGPAVILALDLEMRRASGGERGIVDLLRRLLAEYPAQGRGFEEGTLFQHVNEVAGAVLTPFYERYIAGREFPNLGEALAVIGYESRGQLQRIRSLETLTEAQQQARADFFGLPEAAAPR